MNQDKHEASIYTDKYAFSSLVQNTERITVIEDELHNSLEQLIEYILLSLPMKTVFIDSRNETNRALYVKGFALKQLADFLKGSITIDQTKITEFPDLGGSHVDEVQRKYVRKLEEVVFPTIRVAPTTTNFMYREALKGWL